MQSSFWQTLQKPIISLAPMDGVTDSAMRFITKKYGNPPVLITEFTSAEGIRAGALRLMKDFEYDDSQRPIVAQIFGSDPNAFYNATIVACALGFDGVDINMGCPARSVQEHGAGAALIKAPKLAGEIILSCQKAIQDWANGISLEKANVHPKILEYINSKNLKVEKKLLPLSVKTRIGFDKPVTESWITHLLSFNLANISLHGRTLKQMYKGKADWDEIGKAALLAKDSPTTFLGNGDVDSLEEAIKKSKDYNLDGVLIGRAAFGNPWVFAGIQTTIEDRLKVAFEHAKKFEEVFPSDHFLPMRKHLAWYAKGFENAADLRKKLVLSNSAKEVELLLETFV